MSVNSTTPAAPAGELGRRGRFRLRDARIGVKLALILLVPLVAIGALAGSRLVDGASSAVEAEMVHALAEVAVQATDLGRELHRERIEAVRLLAEPGAELAGFTHQAARTDAKVGDYRAAVSVLPEVPPLVAARLAAIENHLSSLVELRQQVVGDPPASSSAVLLRYGAVLADLNAYHATLPAVVTDPDLAEQSRAVAAIAAAAGHAADAEALARTASFTGVFTDAQREALRATQTGQREAFVAFQQTATPGQRAMVDRTITGANVDTAETAVVALLEGAGGPSAITAAGLSGLADVTHYVQQQLYIDLLDALARTQAAVLRQVIVESAAVVLVLVAAVLVAVLLARMLATALGRLRASAVAVAQTELPAVVARLSDPSAFADINPAELSGQIQVPDRLRTRDEIGQVANALYEVHRTAVHMAGEQAALRTSIAAIFINLARRSQSLVDRMINELDDIERDEADPKRLARMFVLDHLATRMRRNDENLLVLAGVDSSPPRTTDAPVGDVLRAAQSEVERYDRIEFGLIDADITVMARAVNDVVRLIAELFDNATRFSRPDTTVVCEARRLGDYMIIHIEDRGVGMPPHVVDGFNARLAQPPTVEATTFRHMGLAVVGRLASRYQIQVELRSQAGHGTIAYVMLPQSILVMPRARHARPEPPQRPARMIDDTQQMHLNGGALVASSAAPVAPATGYVASGAPASGFSFWSTPRDLPAGGGGYNHGGSVPAAAAPVGWQTAADAGWRAAAAAASPAPQETTRIGLPKRVPQAQLVPGSVDESPAPAPRRSPESARGLLSAYQRGIQRGRQGEPH